MEEKESQNGTPGSKKKRCFFITPIGDSSSQIRRKTDGVINAVIAPVMNKLGFDLEIPHKMTDSGSITIQIVKHILEDEIVIANLTGLNANVMYELAVRHATCKPVICIAEENTTLPFDIATERTIFYSDDMYGVDVLKEKLSSMITSALSVKDADNPIYRAKSDFMMKDIKMKDSEQIILDKLNQIENSIARIQTSKFTPLGPENIHSILHDKIDMSLKEAESNMIDTRNFTTR